MVHIYLSTICEHPTSHVLFVLLSVVVIAASASSVLIIRVCASLPFFAPPSTDPVARNPDTCRWPQLAGFTERQFESQGKVDYSALLWSAVARIAQEQGYSSIHAVSRTLRNSSGAIYRREMSTASMSPRGEVSQWPCLSPSRG